MACTESSWSSATTRVGLKAAREARFAGVPWQRYQFHLQQNAGHYAPRISMRSEVAADMRAIFDAPDREEADRRLKLAIQTYEKTAPSWLPGWRLTCPRA